MGLMFEFSLQTALDVRSRQEKIRMKELAEKLAIEQVIVNKIEQIKKDTTLADTNMNSAKQARVLSTEQMKLLSQFKGRMEVVMGQCQENLVIAKNAVAAKQKVLIEASRAKKTLEILKEKELKRAKEKTAMFERKNMDEIAGNIFVRNQRESQI
ncbi:flagellar export protein FliJ [bacterium]|nr:flagellar export protein FliJ [bacterium]